MQKPLVVPHANIGANGSCPALGYGRRAFCTGEPLQGSSVIRSRVSQVLPSAGLKAVLFRKFIQSIYLRMGRAGRGKGSAAAPASAADVMTDSPGRGKASAKDSARGCVGETVLSAQPAAGPGLEERPWILQERWRAMGPREDIIAFYGHGEQMGELALFSNFYDQSSCPFDFCVPFAFCSCDMSEAERTVRCGFSEKAIMLCKAAAMGDIGTYREIVNAGNPAKAKKLGRAIKGFDDEVWTRCVCSVAFHVVHQKFAKTPSLREKLLRRKRALCRDDPERHKLGYRLGSE